MISSHHEINKKNCSCGPDLALESPQKWPEMWLKTVPQAPTTFPANCWAASRAKSGPDDPFLRLILGLDETIATTRNPGIPQTRAHPRPSSVPATRVHPEPEHIRDHLVPGCVVKRGRGPEIGRTWILSAHGPARHFAATDRHPHLVLCGSLEG